MFLELFSVISVKELQNRNSFGINLVILLCVMAFRPESSGKSGSIIEAGGFLWRGIGVGAKGVVGSDAIVAQQLRTSNCVQLLRNYCAMVVGTNALPFVNYCVSSLDPFYR